MSKSKIHNSKDYKHKKEYKNRKSNKRSKLDIRFNDPVGFGLDLHEFLDEKWYSDN